MQRHPKISIFANKPLSFDQSLTFWPDLTNFWLVDYLTVHWQDDTWHPSPSLILELGFPPPSGCCRRCNDGMSFDGSCHVDSDVVMLLCHGGRDWCRWSGMMFSFSVDVDALKMKQRRSVMMVSAWCRYAAAVLVHGGSKMVAVAGWRYRNGAGCCCGIGTGSGDGARFCSGSQVQICEREGCCRRCCDGVARRCYYCALQVLAVVMVLELLFSSSSRSLTRRCRWMREGWTLLEDGRAVASFSRLWGRMEQWRLTELWWGRRTVVLRQWRVLLWWSWLLGFSGEEARVEDNDMAAFHCTTC